MGNKYFGQGWLVTCACRMMKLFLHTQLSVYTFQKYTKKGDKQHAKKDNWMKQDVKEIIHAKIRIVKLAETHNPIYGYECQSNSWNYHMTNSIQLGKPFFIQGLSIRVICFKGLDLNKTFNETVIGNLSPEVNVPAYPLFVRSSPD